MHKFDFAVWNRFAGDVLLVLPYVGEFLAATFAVVLSDGGSPSDKEAAKGFFWFAVVCGVISHLISAGIIK
jgi:hypothetical protein